MRVTKAQLERAVRILKGEGLKVELDHHQPGGVKHTYRVLLAGRMLSTRRMTPAECDMYLDAMIATVEVMQKLAIKNADREFVTAVQHGILREATT